MNENLKTEEIEFYRLQEMFATAKDGTSLMKKEMLARKTDFYSENVLTLLVGTLLETAFCEDRKDTIDNTFFAISAAQDICGKLIDEYKCQIDELGKMSSDLHMILDTFTEHLDKGFAKPIVEKRDQKNVFID